MRAAIVFCAVVLGMVITTRCQRPHTCFTPQEWNGEFSQRDLKNRFTDRGRIEYDGSGQRISYRDRINGGLGVHDILLFKEGVRYSIPSDGPCTANKMEDKFRPFGIPDNATFIDQYFLGTSAIEGDGVEVTEWGGKTAEGEYIGIVTAKDCIPVNNFFYDNKMEDGLTTFFTDIELGFDPDAFVVPPTCPNATKYKY